MFRKNSSIFKLYFILLIFFVTSAYAIQPFCCFSIVVGKKASVDGAVLFAHNEDDTPPQIVNWYKVPRLSSSPEEFIVLKNGARVPQVSQTWSYLWLEMPGMDFSDSFFNEWGVVIASDACASREKEGELKDGGIGYELRCLMAARARTAKDAVKIGGKLVTEYGYNSSGRTYILADPSEAWVLAVVNGKHWVAQRVPDDEVMVIPNYYTIREINLTDTTNFLGSPDIVDYAIKKEWYIPSPDNAFNFCDAYNSPGSAKNDGNIHRMWRGVNLLANEPYPVTATFPFSFKPAKKIAISDLFSVLRDHYEDTSYDLTAGYQAGSPHHTDESTICAEATQYGFVAQLRDWMPVDIGAVLWLAPRRPCTQLALPWYCGITEIPAGFARADFQNALKNHFNRPEEIYEENPQLAYYQFSIFSEQMDDNYGKKIHQIREKWAEYEMNLLENQADFESRILKIYKQNPEQARMMLNEFISFKATQVREMVKQRME